MNVVVPYLNNGIRFIIIIMYYHIHTSLMFFKINIILFPWFFNGIMKTGLSTFDIQ